jgi:hypothetical protein
MMDTTECQDVFPSTQGMITSIDQGVSAVTHDMIVDFPREPRINRNARKGGAAVSTVSTFPRTRVRISQFSQQFMIPYDDPASKWYTREEVRHFRQAILSEVRTLRDLLGDDATPTALLSEETLCDCLGIENFLSKCTAHLVVHMRRAHCKAILSAQRNHQGEDMVEALARTSWESSRWARKRAARLAQGLEDSVQCWLEVVPHR